MNGHVISSTNFEENEYKVDADDFDDVEEVYEGCVNGDGERHGRGSLYFDTARANMFHGRFRNGVKHGKGCFYFSDGSSLCGNYVNDSLNGVGVYTSSDGSTEVSNYVDGDLNGRSRAYDADGFLTCEGVYQDNVRQGVWKFYSQYGGKIVGVVDKHGKLTGRNIIYVYPDNQTVLKGEFRDGGMVSASVAMYDRIGRTDNPHSYKRTKIEDKFCQDISTYDVISSSPLLSDLFESYRVYVKPSNIDGAGEGLFAKVNAGVGEVMSFYNGVRLSHAEVDGRDWSKNDNTISLDENVVIDVPHYWSNISSYCASLGHKANHSFDPNCKYDRFDHPRFGKIKCIRTIKIVSIDDELTVEYGYDHNKLDTDAPEWYKRKFELWSKK